MTNLPDYFKLKYIVITLLFSLPSAFCFAQQKEANKNYKKGNHYFAAKDYINAIECYTTSINQFHTPEAYYKRAISYIKLLDSCNYCKDIQMANVYGDTTSGKLYKKDCMKFDTIRSDADSIRKEYPGYSYTLISREIHFRDSTVRYFDANHKGIQGIFQKMPEYPGGDEARVRFLRDNIVYPEIAKERHIQGTVYISFIVEKNGTASHIKILRGLLGGLNEEALRVVSLMPRWKPGTRKGIPVKVQYIMPIRWTLN